MVNTAMFSVAGPWDTLSHISPKSPMIKSKPGITLLMIIPEEPEYILLWLSYCEWNQLDGREADLDLIIGDFGEM